MAYNEVTLEGIAFPSDRITFLISGSVTQADRGKAVAQDKTVANTVKLAGDGDEIIGWLFTIENRASQGEGTVCTVDMKGGHAYKTSGAIALGDSIVGAGAGVVKKATVANNTRVWEIDATNNTAVVYI